MIRGTEGVGSDSEVLRPVIKTVYSLGETRPSEFKAV